MSPTYDVENPSFRPSEPPRRRVPLPLAGGGQEGGPRWPIVLPACVLFALHAAMFGAWQIDDAGISFAYARNLALGHGLVAQPGMVPVEGYSNPLWVFLLAGFSALRLFDPLWTPKLLSLGLSFGTFALLDRLLARTGIGARGSLFALLLLAAQTSLVVWSISGLENPLYSFLATSLALLSFREIQCDPPRRGPLLAGLAAAGLALTRPEGILLGLGHPAAIWFAANRSTPRGRLGRLAVFFAAWLLPVGLHLGFRWIYFGALTPNTYLAKGGPKLASFRIAELLGREGALGRAVAGPGGGWLIGALAAVAIFLAVRRRLPRQKALLTGLALVASLPYAFLPPDWMPELRFATPFFPLFYVAAIALAATLWNEIPRGVEIRSRLALVGGLLAIGIQLTSTVPRTLSFAAEPTVPFATVENRYGRGFNRFADRLGVERGSLLLPDVGGAYWGSRLTVYDLGGLCDRTIARTLGKNDRALHDYVFGTLRPTFIHTHQYWTYKAKLDRDPRFERDYLSLFEQIEPYVAARAQGRKLRSGDFVRREAAEGHAREIEAIRAELAARYGAEQAR